MKKNSQVVKLQGKIKLLKMEVREAKRSANAWQKIAQKAAAAIDKSVVNIVKAIAKYEAPAKKKPVKKAVVKKRPAKVEEE